MILKVAEVLLDNGDAELIFDELINREDFDLILSKFKDINGVKVLKKTEDETNKACLLSNGVFEFVLAYSTDSFLWNYAYAVKRENHGQLKDLCKKLGEFVSK